MVTVDVYLPQPMRCFKCQRLGHHRKIVKEMILVHDVVKRDTQKHVRFIVRRI